VVNVNKPDQLPQGVNIKLGKHMKAVLLFLYEKKGHALRQKTIIRDVCDLYDHKKAKERKIDPFFYPLPISRCLRASMCRAFTLLEDHELIQRQRYKYSYEYKGRPLYQKWQDGEYVQVRTEPKPTKTWISKPWFGITEKGIEYVNNCVHMNSMEAV